MRRRPFYTSVLRGFVSEYRGAPALLQEWLAAGKRDDIFRLAHTLKANAQGIGAHSLSDAARAVDYITKPFHVPIVRARVRNHVEAVSHRRLLERLALVDGLTEIPNRRRLEQALQLRWPAGQPLSVVLIDVDHFKLYNDHYGHSGGDRVLRQVAGAVQQSLKRETDLAARYGGEEFVLFLPHTDAEGGQACAELARLAVQALAIPHAKSLVGPLLSISLGGASVLLPASGEVPPGVLEQSDQQLYRAKQLGRNRVSWAA